MRFARVMLVIVAAALVAVPAALAIRFTDDSFNMPVGVVGVPYSKQFNGAAGCGPALPYQYRILNGGLPPGLSLSKSGLISGTPTQAGSWSFWVELSDEDPPSAAWCLPAKAEREFTINVIAGLSVDTPSTPPGTVGSAYSLGLAASGGGTQTWSISAGSLPPGLALSGSTLSGTPTTAGTYTFTVRVTDGTRSATKSFTLPVRDPLAIPAVKVPQLEVGQSQPFQLKLASTGGSGTNTWTIAGALPQGITFDPATQTFAGAPAAAGSFTVKVTVTDSEGRTASADVPLVVAAKLGITTKRLPVVKAGKVLNVKLRTVGGAGTVNFKATAGRFPTGVHLDRTTGTLSGTTRKAGVYRFTIEAQDELGVGVSQSYVLTVKAAPKHKKKK
jgi:large repetitive protein